MKDMLEQGVIESRSEGSAWTSPIVLVKKKDQTWRFCVDFRGVNKVTNKANNPLPRPEDNLNSLYGCTRFSCLDIKSAYYQIGMTERAKERSAFVVPGYGVHVFKKMPFGLVNAPFSFQSLVEKALPVAKDGRLFKDNDSLCFAYIDDIVIPSRTIEEGLDNLETILEALIQHGL